jgi:hypothetical protein
MEMFFANLPSFSREINYTEAGYSKTGDYVLPASPKAHSPFPTTHHPMHQQRAKKKTRHKKENGLWSARLAN